jgi:hypothetical protein
MRVRLLSAAAALALFVACASVPLKQQISADHQGLRQALTLVDDTERGLCMPDAAAPNHCTAKDAATLGLTDARHQALSRVLADAYDLSAKVGQALIAWRAGDPIPSDLLTLLADAQEAVTQISAFAPGSQLMQKAQDVVTKAKALIGRLAS